MTNAWEVSIAATLAADRMHHCFPNMCCCICTRGIPVSKVPEQQLFAAHPQVGGRLIEGIPRLEVVADIIRRQNEPYRATLAKGKQVR